MNKNTVLLLRKAIAEADAGLALAQADLASGTGLRARVSDCQACANELRALLGLQPGENIFARPSTSQSGTFPKSA